MKHLAALSRHYGQQPEHVQAGGGNSSLKHKNGELTVKASGCLLAEVNETHGFVTLPRQPLVDFFTAPSLPSEADYHAMIAELVPLSAPQPSMESGFHAVLPGRYVLHTHSVYAAILASAAAGRALLNNLQADFLLLPYLTPGLPLSRHIAMLENPPAILLLQNHGVIVQADSVESLQERYETLHRQLLALLGSIEFPMPLVENGISRTAYPVPIQQETLFSEGLEHIVSPDQAIYFSLRNRYRVEDGKIHYAVDAAKAAAMEQMAAFVSCLRREHQKRHWQTDFIPPEHIRTLLNLQSEHYRQQKGSA